MSAQLEREVKYIPATQYEAGREALELIEEGQSAVVGFLMNHLVDSTKIARREDLDPIVKREIIRHTEDLRKIQGRKIYVMLPYPRPKYPWLSEILASIHEVLKIGLEGANNVKILKYLAVSDDEFEGDGIHINQAGCLKQFNHVTEELRGILTSRGGKRLAEVDPSMMGSPYKRKQTSNEMPARGRGRGGRRGGNIAGREQWNIGSTSDDLGERVNELARDVRDLRYESMATWEATDVSTNKLSQNILILDLVPNSEKTEAVEVAKELAENAGLETDLVIAAFFVAGKTNEGCFPRIRIVLRDNNAAFQFRTEGLKLRREGKEPWNSLYISNDSTKGTRVRIEILKKIAEKIANDPCAKDFELMVNKFDPRPMLLFKKNRRVSKRIPYPEAVSRWGNRLQPEDLDQPRKIAGKELGHRFRTMFGF